MANVLGNLNRSLLLGGALLVIAILILNGNALDVTWFNAFMRFLHALVGVVWIGLLYYLFLKLLKGSSRNNTRIKMFKNTAKNLGHAIGNGRLRNGKRVVQIKC